MGLHQVISLSGAEKFLGGCAGVVLIDDPSRRCFEARSATERIVLEPYGEERGDFVGVVDEFAVLVYRMGDECIVHVYQLASGELVADQALSFEVWCGTATRDALILSGYDGFAVMDKASHAWRCVAPSAERSRIALRVMVTCGPWLIGVDREYGVECRDPDSLWLRWTRVADPNAPAHVSSLHCIDSRSCVAEWVSGDSRWIEVVDAETGTLLRRVCAEGRLVAAVNRRILVRSEDGLAAYAADSDTIEWRASLARSDVVVPSANGCWIQRGAEVARVDCAGRQRGVVAIDEGAALVAGSDEVLLVHRCE